ncbi:MAG: LytTR family transcriptional regulator [Bacteroidales bacterium]|nr:LytTR family transcriptional regulator [Bacteroidales bacterium]
MKNGQIETWQTRIISVCFTILALAVFKPFGLDAWHWEAYAHLLLIGLLGALVCVITELILKWVVRMPRRFEVGVDYIIRRNLWFQLINTLLVTVMICFYRHFLLSDRVAGNRLSWSNFFETLIIIAFCSFAIGLYWRFKFRSRYLAAELEETRLLNEHLQLLQQDALQQVEDVPAVGTNEKESSSQKSSSIAQLSSSFILKGTTNDTVTIRFADLLYVEAVGNYVKVYQWRDEQIKTDMIRATMKQVEGDLMAFPSAVRCHRAFLVNLQQVEQIVSRSGAMHLLIRHSHDSIPVSRSNVAQVKEAITSLSSVRDR